MEYLKIWTSFAEIIEPLNDAERGRLFTAMLIYAEREELPEFKGNERYIWPVAKQAIDRARAESEKQTANGSKGGRPKNNPEKPTETQQNPEKPTETLKEKDKEKEKINKETTLKGSKEKPLTRFTPPTVEEVATYCRERQNGVDAQRFVDFYAAKGWKIGQNTMKDWKAAVRTWEQRSDSPQKLAKTVSGQQYEQRKYSEDELLAVSGDLIAEARANRGKTA
jgi:hypothetical protein